jgi:hypothetical protein
MTTSRRDITKRLVELRGKRSQADIGAQVGVTPQAVSGWERTGKIAKEHVRAYDEALGADGEVLALLGLGNDTTTMADVSARLAALDEKINRLIDEGVALQQVVRGGFAVATEGLRDMELRLRRLERRTGPPNEGDAGKA